MRVPAILFPALLLLAGCVRNNYVVVVPRPAVNLAAFNNPACLRPADTPPVVPVGEQFITRTIDLPPATRQARINGCAGALYRVDPSGRPIDIRLVREYPAGYGYGAALVTALQDFRFRPSPTNAGWHYFETSQ